MLHVPLGFGFDDCLNVGCCDLCGLVFLDFGVICDYFYCLGYFVADVLLVLWILRIT